MNRLESALHRCISRDVVCSGWCSPPLDLKRQIMLFHYITQVVDITKRARNSLLPAFWKVSQMSSVCGLCLNEVNHHTLQHLYSAAFCSASSEKDDYRCRANVKTRCVVVGSLLTNCLTQYLHSDNCLSVQTKIFSQMSCSFRTPLCLLHAVVGSHRSPPWVFVQFCAIAQESQAASVQCRAGTSLSACVEVFNTHSTLTRHDSVNIFHSQLTI